MKKYKSIFSKPLKESTTPGTSFQEVLSKKVRKEYVPLAQALHSVKVLVEEEKAEALEKILKAEQETLQAFKNAAQVEKILTKIGSIMKRDFQRKTVSPVLTKQRDSLIYYYSSNLGSGVELRITWDEFWNADYEDAFYPTLMEMGGAEVVINLIKKELKPVMDSISFLQIETEGVIAYVGDESYNTKIEHRSWDAYFGTGKKRDFFSI